MTEGDSLDTPPQLFRETPRSRRSWGELVMIALPVLGAAAFLALIVAIIVFVNSVPASALQ
jgi:hypothetical protein